MVRRRKANPNQPVRVASGQPYGQRQQQEQAQRAQPLPNADAIFQQAMAAAGEGGGLVGAEPLPDMSQRPDEPVTFGLPTGAGPGPEALGPLALPPAQRDPDLIYLASQLPVLEALAERPQASVTLRNLVRRLRSMIPPDFDFKELMAGPQVADPENVDDDDGIEGGLEVIE